MLAPVRGRLVAAGIAQALGAVASLLPYLAIYRIATELLRDGPVEASTVWVWALLAVVGVVVRTAVTGFAYTVTHAADISVTRVLRAELVGRLWRVPLGWFGERSSGLVKRRLQDDVHDVHHLVAHAVNDLVAAVVAPLAGFVLLFVVNWRLGLVCLVPVLLYLVGLSVMMRGNSDNAARWDEALNKVNSRIVEYVQGIAVVETFGQARSTQDRYRAVGDDLASFFERWMGPLLRVNALASTVLSPPTVVEFVLAIGVLVRAAGLGRAGRGAACADARGGPGGASVEHGDWGAGDAPRDRCGRSPGRAAAHAGATAAVRASHSRWRRSALRRVRVRATAGSRCSPGSIWNCGRER